MKGISNDSDTENTGNRTACDIREYPDFDGNFGCVGKLVGTFRCKREKSGEDREA